ncbi:MAG: hypothetical protein V9E82_11095 [Candidatus Nanopelagicales bacterium]
MQRPRWWIPTLVYALVALLIGYAAATGVNGLLALSLSPKDLPPTTTVPVTATETVAPPSIETLAMPAGWRGDPLLVLAARTFQDAVEQATGTRPEVVDGAADFTASRAPELPDGAYRLTREGVAGSGRSGVADGVFAGRPTWSRAAPEYPTSPANRSWPTSSTGSPTTARWGSSQTRRRGRPRTTTPTTPGSSPR